MELSYTTEITARRAVKQMRRIYGKLNFLQTLLAVLAVCAILAAIAYVAGTMFDTDILDFPPRRPAIILLSVMAVCVFFVFLINRFFVGRARKALRGAKSLSVEYHLTDDTLEVKCAEATFSSAWFKAARKFKLYGDALILFGKPLPFEAQCIADWKRGGIRRDELVSALKSAELERTMKKRWKVPIWLAASVVALTALLAIYIVIGSFEWGDWTIPDEFYEEMRVDATSIPDEENTLAHLLALTNICSITCCTDDAANQDSDTDFVSYYGNPHGRRLTGYDNTEEWEKVRNDPSASERAMRILAQNDAFFKAFPDAMAFRRFGLTSDMAKEKKEAEEAGQPFGILPTHIYLVRYSQLFAFRAQLALERGDIESAVADIIQIHSLGSLIVANNENLVQYLVGTLIERFSFEKMCDLIAAQGTPADETLEVFDRLVAISEATAPLARKRAIKNEANKHTRELDGLLQGKYKIVDDFSKMDNCFFVPKLSLSLRILRDGPWWLRRFAFHHRKLMFHLAMFNRAMLAGDDTLSEMLFKALPKNPLLPNGMGNDLLIPSFTQIPERFFIAERLKHSRIRLVLAAAKWRKSHDGANPPSLAALVPEYIPAIPTDPWSKKGEPLQYDPALGVVWSIGKNGDYDYRKYLAESENGASEEAHRNTLDYAIHLDGLPATSPALPQP